MNSGKNMHLNLIIVHLKEALANKDFQLSHLDTKYIVADIGAKAKAPRIFKHLADFRLGHITLEAFLPLLKELIRYNI